MDRIASPHTLLLVVSFAILMEIAFNDLFAIWKLVLICMSIFVFLFIILLSVLVNFNLPIVIFEFDSMVPAQMVQSRANSSLHFKRNTNLVGLIDSITIELDE
jgi:hypothetical protein